MPCFYITVIVVLFFLSELRNMVFYYYHMRTRGTNCYNLGSACIISL